MHKMKKGSHGSCFTPGRSGVAVRRSLWRWFLLLDMLRLLRSGSGGGEVLVVKSDRWKAIDSPGVGNKDGWSSLS